MPDLRVVVFHDGDCWIAQCLEHDVATQAADLPTLRKRFFAAVMCEHKEGNFSALPPAPTEFHEMWSNTQQRLSTIDEAPYHDGLKVNLDIALRA